MSAENGLPDLLEACSTRADLDRTLARITVHLYLPKDGAATGRDVYDRDATLRRCVIEYVRRARQLTAHPAGQTR